MDKSSLLINTEKDIERDRLKRLHLNVKNEKMLCPKESLGGK